MEKYSVRHFYVFLGRKSNWPLFSKTHLKRLTSNDCARSEENIIDGHDLSGVKHLHGLIQKPEQMERNEQDSSEHVCACQRRIRRT